MDKYQESQKAEKEKKKEKAVLKKKLSQVNESQRESLLGIQPFENISNQSRQATAGTV